MLGPLVTANPKVRALERKAKREAIGLSLAGVLLMAVGLWATYSQPTGVLVLLITLVIFGPVMVFLAIIGYFSYLETLEEDRYTPHVVP